MKDFTVNKQYDFQLVSAKIGDNSFDILVRTKDGYTSVSPTTGETPDRMVANFQRVIDTVVFGNDLNTYTEITLVRGFNFYVPDYTPLSAVVVNE